MLDWRKEEDYKYTDDLPLEGWAWEFLRRNPEYIKDYENVQETLKTRSIVLPPDKNYSLLFLNHRAQLALLPENEGLLFLRPEKNDDETISEWMQRCAEDESFGVLSLIVHMGRKWGLNGPIQNPEYEYKIPKEKKETVKTKDKKKKKKNKKRKISEQRTLFQIPSNVTILRTLEHATSYYKGEESNCSLQDGKAVIGFSLEHEIKPQIEDAKGLLKELQEKHKKLELVDVIPKKNTKAQWKKYIRMLDAKSNGATNAEMAKAFYSKNSDVYPEKTGSKQISTALKTAKYLSAKGYIEKILV